MVWSRALDASAGQRPACRKSSRPSFPRSLTIPHETGVRAPTSLCLLRTSALGDVTHDGAPRCCARCRRPGHSARAHLIVGSSSTGLSATSPASSSWSYSTRPRGWKVTAPCVAPGAVSTPCCDFGGAAREPSCPPWCTRRCASVYDRGRARICNLPVRQPAHRRARHGRARALDAVGSFVRPLGLRQDVGTLGHPDPDAAQAFAALVSAGDTPALVSLLQPRPATGARALCGGDGPRGAAWAGVVLCGGPRRLRATSPTPSWRTRACRRWTRVGKTRSNGSSPVPARQSGS